MWFDRVDEGRQGQRSKLGGRSLNLADNKEDQVGKPGPKGEEKRPSNCVKSEREAKNSPFLNPCLVFSLDIGGSAFK